jgi:hypothetical protein
MKSNINLKINIPFHLKVKDDLNPVNDLFRTIYNKVCERERERERERPVWPTVAISSPSNSIMEIIKGGLLPA